MKTVTPNFYHFYCIFLSYLLKIESKKRHLLFMLFVLLLSSNTIQSQAYVPDTCSQWLPYGTIGNDALLFLKTCETPDATFGYLEIKNETVKDVKLHYVINFNNGSSVSGNVMVPYDDKVSKIACPNCIQSIGNGIAGWSFDSILYEGEPDY